MQQLSTEQQARIAEVARLLREAERPVRVLRSLAWPESVAQEFFDRGCTEPPKPEYPPFDPGPTLEAVIAAQALIDGDTPVHTWLHRTARAISTAARMLSVLGTKEFFVHSSALYGTPETPILDGKRTSLQLAEAVDGILASFNNSPASFGSVPARVTAEELADLMRRRVSQHFGSQAPEVQVVDQLSSKALAGSRYIRIRRDAVFSDLDVRQLINHEAYVHIGTTLNGLQQQSLPILASAHAGTTNTQEGLAVFSELISGGMDPPRFQRLGARSIAIKACMEGADFMELYSFFLARSDSPEEAFEDARRVIRGGPISGGAPFTKDCTYLYGLLRVHNFLRSAVAAGRIDCMGLLFCGKIDLDDIPAMGLLAEIGMLQPPRFLPPMFSDPRFLVAYLAYSAYLNTVNLPVIAQYYQELFAATPPVEVMASVCYFDRHDQSGPGLQA
ncbi:DUF1704 domain-containing protein [bacterium]|nr:DUF1704 domain-containing protein [bacterium]